jgi:hypothetical protein
MLLGYLGLLGVVLEGRVEVLDVLLQESLLFME